MSSTCHPGRSCRMFPGSSDVVGEDFQDRAFLAVRGWHYTDVQAVFVETIQHAFGGKNVFAVMDFVPANLNLFVAASWFANATNPLQVSLQRVS